MKSVLAIAGFVLLLAGCKASLRAPICADGEFEFPAGAEGTYKLSMIRGDTVYSGYYVGFSDLVFEIKELPSVYELTVPKAALASVDRRLKSTLTGLRAPPDDGGLGRPVLPLATCRIGNRYYAQAREDDGTYSLARIDLAANGITSVDLGFDAKKVRNGGFKTYFWPNLDVTEDEPDQPLRWSAADLTTPGRMVVDNTGMDDESRSRLLQLASPTAFGLVYSRVAPEEAVKYWRRVGRDKAVVTVAKAERP
jgi:hypothetical protein